MTEQGRDDCARRMGQRDQGVLRGKLALLRGSNDGGEDLLCASPLGLAVAATDFAGYDGGSQGLFGAPVGGVD